MFRTRPYSVVSLVVAIAALGPAYRAMKPLMALKYCRKPTYIRSLWPAPGMISRCLWASRAC